MKRLARLLAFALGTLVLSGCAADVGDEDLDDDGFIDVDSDGNPDDDDTDGDDSVAEADADEETGTTTSALTGGKCSSDPECSIGRPRAVLSVRGTALRNVLTNTGRRTLSEAEVNTGKSYVSGCKKNLCAIYWVSANGAGSYANVPRKFLRVYSGTKKKWYSAADGAVRRLGGPVIKGSVRRRVFVASNALNDIWHPTHGGKGEAPLVGYSCTNIHNGPCKYVVGADAPPNTRDGGKGYVAGIFQAGKSFYALDRTVEVDVFRRSDKRPGKAEWIYGYVSTTNGRIYQWVMRSVRIQEKNGSWRTYPGYIRTP